MKMLLRTVVPILVLALLIGRAQSQEAQQTAKPTTQLEMMQHLEDLWSDALAKRDQYGLELVLSPQFVNISAEGDVRTRNQEIANVLTKYPDLISLEQKVVSVRTLGDVALVNGTYILRRRVNGHAVDEKGIFSHVFQRVRSNWQCINAQRTIVVEQAVNGRSGSVAPKQSKAELPFHIPLFHKGDEPAPPAASSSGQSNPQ
jgi:ketosteroid isomerase-like protein